MRFALKSFGVFLLFQVIIITYKRNSFVLDAIAFLLYMIQVVCLFRLYQRSCPGELKMGYNAKSMLYMLTYSILLFLCFSMVEQGFLSYLKPDSDQSKEFARVYILYLTTLGPLSEELLFRGIVLNQLNKKYSFVIANIIQAGIFSLLHFDAYVFLFGALFGFAMGMLSRHFHIYYAILLHIINNVLATVVKKIPIDLPRTAYLIIGIVFTVPTVILLWKLKEYKRPRTVVVGHED